MDSENFQVNANNKQENKNRLISRIILLFVVISIILSLAFIKNVRNYFFPAPITATVKTLEGKQKNDYFYFDEDIKFNNLASIFLTQSNNHILSTSPNIKIGFDNQNDLYIEKGIFFLDITEEITLHINEQNLPISQNSKIIYDSNLTSIYVFGGNINYLNEKIGNNYFINLSAKEPKSEIINRPDFLKNPNYQKLIDYLSETNYIPNNLKDFNIPEISNLKPNENMTVEDDQIEISGTTPKNSTLMINGQKIDTKENNFFSYIANLEIGENEIQITLTDENNNFNEYNYIITRESTQTQSTDSQDLSNQQNNICSSDFANQLLDYINDYRQSNSLNTMIIDEKLNLASCNHSSWMNQTQNFSHTGENNSQFYERCQLVKTTCDAENLAYGTTDAQHVFNLWKDSAGHNANMLGDHQYFGAALSGTYSTAVFR